MTLHQAPATRHAPSGEHRASIAVAVALAGTTLVVAAGLGCAPDPEAERLKATTLATYDEETGRLERLTYDGNKNGVIDTWTHMEGTKPLWSEIDANEDGKIGRWEYYGDDGKVEKVALSRGDTGVADMWLYPDAKGAFARAELSSRPDGTVDRWEWYESGVIVRAEQDANADGRVDKWETYASGAVVSAAFDEDGDGRPDRKLSYDPNGALVSIESGPDANGAFTRKVDVPR
jgi:hypothetical protein